jgi:hypothetical protein
LTATIASPSSCSLEQVYERHPERFRDAIEHGQRGRLPIAPFELRDVDVNHPLEEYPVDLVQLVQQNRWTGSSRLEAQLDFIDPRRKRPSIFTEDGQLDRIVVEAPSTWLQDFRWAQAFMREVLTALVQNRPALASRAEGVIAQVRHQLFTAGVERGPEGQPGDWKVSLSHFGEAVVDFSFRRGRGFVLDVHPAFTRVEEAYWYGFALLLDHRRDFARRLTICHARSGANGQECGRFFWRTPKLQHYCSPRCSRTTERVTNVRRQQRLRLKGDRRAVRIRTWLKHHPGDTPAQVARGLRADLDEIAELYARLERVGLLEPSTKP